MARPPGSPRGRAAAKISGVAKVLLADAPALERQFADPGPAGGATCRRPQPRAGGGDHHGQERLPVAAQFDVAVSVVGVRSADTFVRTILRRQCAGYPCSRAMPSGHHRPAPPPSTHRVKAAALSKARMRR